MASRHETVKLRSRNRHVSVTPLPRLKPPASWQLDLANERLHRGGEATLLPPKVFAVLRYLHEHPGRLVTKQELLDAVWPDIAVTEAVLKNCILKLRETLGDDAKRPRYIETVHRRGYRLLAPFSTTLPVQGSTFQVQGQDQHGVQSQAATSRKPHSTISLVGRDADLAQLHTWLAKALNGERQIAFITGEPGIGKTALLEAFLRGLRNWELGVGSHSAHSPNPISQLPDPVPWLGRGQCIEHYGQGEAYLPILSALGQLCREAGGKRLVQLLNQHAPTWLVQMPALLTNEEFEALQRKTAGATKERMLREMAEALEAIAAERPLVLVLEDLHWSDPSTLDLLAFVARRSQPARLLITSTYRPAEMLAAEHPLRAVVQELQLHQQCEELVLGLLTEADVAAYLTQRCPLPSPFQGEGQDESVSAAPFHDLAWVIHQRTEGNPLFMVNVVDDLLARGDLESANVEINAPTTILEMIERQVERLTPEDQQLIETASVAGIEFSAAAVAAGSEAAIEEVERSCATLARRGQFLHTAGVSEWPDGTIASRYAFQHALYQEVIYDRVTAAQKVTLHRRIGERQEHAYGNRAKEIATELAVHFEQGRNYRKAVHYLQHAAENAQRKNAHQEAISLAARGLEVLKALPDTPERVQQELPLQLALNAALVPVKGYTAPDVEKTVLRTRELCQQLEDTPQFFLVLQRAFLFYFNRRELQTALELGEEMMRLAQGGQDRYFLSIAHSALGVTLYYLGELTSARTHLEQVIALYDPQKHPRTIIGTADPRVDCLSFVSWTLWRLGYPDQGLKQSQEALALAAGLSHPYSLAFALGMAALFHALRREGQLAQEQAEAAMALSTEQGFPFWLTIGMAVRDWALAEQGQIEEGSVRMHQGPTARGAMGVRNGWPWSFAVLAEAYGKRGQAEKGLTLLTEALAIVNKTEERVGEAELYRLKGELTLQHQSKIQGPKSKGRKSPGSEVRSSESEAEECFLKAIEISQRQQAKSLELRATVGLAHLWQQQGKQKEARQMLSQIYNWFTEGFDTKDLQEAKALLEKLH